MFEYCYRQVFITLFLVLCTLCSFSLSDADQFQPVTVQVFFSAYDGLDKNLLQRLSEVKSDFAAFVKIEFHPIYESQITGELLSPIERESLIKSGLISCFQSINPDGIVNFVRCLEEHHSTSWEECGTMNAVSAELLKGCYSSEILRSLQDNSYTIALKYSITQSPTVVINGKMIQNFTDPLQVRRLVCTELPDEKIDICESLPHCFSNTDCQKEGYIGICEHGGTAEATCIYKEPVKIALSIVTPNHEFFPRTQAILDITRKNFPGVAVSSFPETSEEGQNLLSQYEASMLPLFIFSNELMQAFNYRAFEEAFRKKGDLLYLAPFQSGATIIADRQRIPSKIAIFCRSYSLSSMQQVAFLMTLLKMKENARFLEKLDIHYLTAQDESGTLITAAGRMELEENLRQLAVLCHWPDNYSRYIDGWIEEFKTSYWEDIATQANIDPHRLKTAARAEKTILRARSDAALVDSLPYVVSDSFFVLIENREMFVPRNEHDLAVLLKKMKEESGRHGR